MTQPPIPWRLYAITASVFLGSFLLATFLPAPESIKILVATPGIGALFLALLQLLRDRWAHDRVLEIKDREHDFALGTASHMAEKAYDKHAEFCDQYMERAQAGLQELVREGPTEKALTTAVELGQIRTKFAAWLTEEIDEQLRPFENALAKIASHQFMLKHGEPISDRRQKIVEEMYDLYLAIIDPKKEEDSEEKVAVSRSQVIQRIRSVLGIDDLVALRNKAVALASSRIAKP